MVIHLHALHFLPFNRLSFCRGPCCGVSCYDSCTYVFELLEIYWLKLNTNDLFCFFFHSKVSMVWGAGIKVVRATRSVVSLPWCRGSRNACLPLQWMVRKTSGARNEYTFFSDLVINDWYACSFLKSRERGCKEKPGFHLNINTSISIG